MPSEGNKEMSFWDHLEELRGTIVRSAVALIVAFFALFCFKDFLFDTLVLAPTRNDFFLYRWLGTDTCLSLVNIEIAAQFMVHMKVAFIAALLLCVPYIIFEIWKFVAPGLYENEKRAVRIAFAFSSLLFYLGVFIGYTIVVPLMVNFFYGYSVSASVVNTISLGSYISMLSSTVLLFGLVFELPAIILALSRLGFVTRTSLIRVWRYAVLAIVVLAAIITPSGDPFSLAVVSLPLFLLYGLSILICKPEKPVEE